MGKFPDTQPKPPSSYLSTQAEGSWVLNRRHNAGEVETGRCQGLAGQQVPASASMVSQKPNWRVTEEEV